jgi:hypothetical protein
MGYPFAWLTTSAAARASSSVSVATHQRVALADRLPRRFSVHGEDSGRNSGRRASVADRADRGLHRDVANLPRLAHARGEIERADEDRVDAGHGQNLADVARGVDVLRLRNQNRGVVVAVHAVLHARSEALGARDADAARACRWIPPGAHSLAFGGRADVGADDARGACIEAFAIQIGSFIGTRTMHGHEPAAWMIRWTAAKSSRPCSMSTKSQSKPALAQISATSGEGSVSSVPTSGSRRPSRALNEASGTSAIMGPRDQSVAADQVPSWSFKYRQRDAGTFSRARRSRNSSCISCRASAARTFMCAVAWSDSRMARSSTVRFVERAPLDQRAGFRTASEFALASVLQCGIANPCEAGQ